MSGKRLEIVNPADAPEVHVPEGKRKADRVTTVYAWGSTRKGVTGIPVPRGVKPEPRGPAVVEKLKDASVVQVWACEERNVAMTEAGEVYEWGLIRRRDEDAQELSRSLRSSGGFKKVSSHSTTQDVVYKEPTLKFLEGHTAVQVSCGPDYSAVLTTTGHVLTWGSDLACQLGHGSGTVTYEPRPQLVRALADRFVVHISCGRQHMAAVTDDGEVFIWGDFLKEIIVPEKVQRLAGRHIVQVACGAEFMLALTEDGTVLSWGHATHGELGQGREAGLRTTLDTPKRISSLAKHVVVQISCGLDNAACVTNSGLIFAWGSGRSGRLGNGNMRGDVVQPTSVGGLTSGRAIALGDGHSAVLTRMGGVYMFGENHEQACAVPKNEDGGMRTRASSRDPNAADDLEDLTTLVLEPRLCRVFPEKYALQICCGRAHTILLVAEDKYDVGVRNEALDLVLGHLDRKPGEAEKAEAEEVAEEEGKTEAADPFDSDVEAESKTLAKQISRRIEPFKRADSIVPVRQPHDGRALFDKPRPVVEASELETLMARSYTKFPPRHLTGSMTSRVRSNRTAAARVASEEMERTLPAIQTARGRMTADSNGRATATPACSGRATGASSSAGGPSGARPRRERAPRTIKGTSSLPWLRTETKTVDKDHPAFLDAVATEPADRDTYDIRVLCAVTRPLETFRQMDRFMHEQIMRYMTMKEMEPDTTVFEQGDRPLAWYTIFEGECSVRVKLSAMSEEYTTVATLPAGKNFGELGLLQGKLRSAAIVTSKPTRFLVIDKNSYALVMQTSHKLELEDKLALLGRVPIFSSSTRLLLSQLAPILRGRVFAKGEVIIEHGAEPTDGLYFLESGRCIVTKPLEFDVVHRQGMANQEQSVSATDDNADAKRKIRQRTKKVRTWQTSQRKNVRVATLLPGEFFGEIALIYKTTRQANVIAAEDGTRIFTLGIEDFKFRVHKEMIRAMKDRIEARDKDENLMEIYKAQTRAKEWRAFKASLVEDIVQTHRTTRRQRAGHVV